MHLTNRSRGNRFIIKLREDLLERLAELRFDDLPNRRGWIALDVGLQLLQFGRQRRADQIGPHAEDLSQLDERRSQIHQRHANPRFAGVVRERNSILVFEPIADKVDFQLAEPVGQSITPQHGHDFLPAAQIAVELRDRGNFHGTGFASNSNDYANCAALGTDSRLSRSYVSTSAFANHVCYNASY